MYNYFNSLAPCGANLMRFKMPSDGAKFQLTRPVRGEPRFQRSRSEKKPISTHSPRAGRTAITAAAAAGIKISTHSPRAGRTLCDVRVDSYVCISTHSPRAGRTPMLSFQSKSIAISTHSPRAGRTILMKIPLIRILDFNSLAPCGANRCQHRYPS